MFRPQFFLIFPSSKKQWRNRHVLCQSQSFILHPLIHPFSPSTLLSVPNLPPAQAPTLSGQGGNTRWLNIIGPNGGGGGGGGKEERVCVPYTLTVRGGKGDIATFPCCSGRPYWHGPPRVNEWVRERWGEGGQVGGPEPFSRVSVWKWLSPEYGFFHHHYCYLVLFFLCLFLHENNVSNHQTTNIISHSSQLEVLI